MLLNPFKTNIQVLPGSRILSETFGLLGVSIEDPRQAGRQWTIRNVYAPITRRKLSGLRVKLEDDKGFVTFCNQRDLEMLVGLASPGNLCCWTETTYPEWDSPEFFGLCADDEDLRDDLFDRELALRAENPGVLPYGLEIFRYVHLDGRSDHQDLLTMLYDCDRQSGLGPDPRMHTLSHRWASIERIKVRWEYL